MKNGKLFWIGMIAAGLLLSGCAENSPEGEASASESEKSAATEQTATFAESETAPKETTDGKREISAAAEQTTAPAESEAAPKETTDGKREISAATEQTAAPAESEAAPKKEAAEESVRLIRGGGGALYAADGSEITVSSAAEAAEVLNRVTGLFGEGFAASEADITVTENGEEVFYRYSPRVNGVPVIGNQLILSAMNGTVTGLFGRYDPRVETVDLTSMITAEAAEEIAFSDFFGSVSGVAERFSEMSGLSLEEAEAILRGSFEVESVSAIASIRELPELIRSVTLKNSYEYEDDGDTVTEVDWDDPYDYGNYFFSDTIRTYSIAANGENAGEILYVDDWIET